jgi:hypothetical protein
MAHQVFLSCAREDSETASRVCEILEADGTRCWLPSRDATARKDKAAANLRAIRTSDMVLLLFSVSANASPTVLRDIERAISYERPVLSLHLDGAAPTASLEYYLNLWQWLDASGGVEDKREDILAAVRAQLAGTADSGIWRWLDAPGGVDTKREEILAAVQGQLAQTAASATSQEPDASAAASRRRPSRRTWGIVLGAVLVALALGLGLGLGLTGTSHQGAWTKLDPAGTVPPASGCNSAMTYDPSSGRVIMFGGCSDPLDPFCLQYPPHNDTWAYDPAANTWTQPAPAGRLPPPRAAPTMAYDPITQRLILLGGFDRPIMVDGGILYHATADTWAYDPVANTWTELDPSGTVPPPRFSATAVHDPITGRLIVFGGGADSASVLEQGLEPSSWVLNDIWAYDPVANTWTELTPSGPLPPRRFFHAMVYDPSTRRMIMFGGMGDTGVLNDIWAYDPAANTWIDLDPSGTLPEARYGSGMAYDSSSQRVVMFGGSVADGSRYFNDTWVYDPVANTWTELRPSGVLPGARFAPALVCAPSTGQVLMFGGVAAGVKTSLNDIWAFTP